MADLTKFNQVLASTAHLKFLEGCKSVVSHRLHSRFPDSYHHILTEAIHMFLESVPNKRRALHFVWRGSLYKEVLALSL
jgi:hypothetical protein